MGRCGCETIIECEVKTDQTVESINNTRWEGGKIIVTQLMIEYEMGVKMK